MTNIIFNNKNYPVDDSLLSTHSAALKSHLSTVMNGTGAVINFGGTTYSVDSAKLEAAKNDLVSHLGNISGNGHRVVIDGVEYGIDSTKLQSAIAEIDAVLGGLNSDDVEENMIKLLSLDNYLLKDINGVLLTTIKER